MTPDTWAGLFVTLMLFLRALFNEWRKRAHASSIAGVAKELGAAPPAAPILTPAQVVDRDLFEALALRTNWLKNELGVLQGQLLARDVLIDGLQVRIAALETERDTLAALTSQNRRWKSAARNWYASWVQSLTIVPFVERQRILARISMEWPNGDYVPPTPDVPPDSLRMTSQGGTDEAESKEEEHG